MTRKEASALFQEGIVNAKSLVSASRERVATALRINVPYQDRNRHPSGAGGAKNDRKMRGGGGGGSTVAYGAGLLAAREEGGAPGMMVVVVLWRRFRKCSPYPCRWFWASRNGVHHRTACNHPFVCPCELGTYIGSFTLSGHALPSVLLWPSLVPIFVVQTLSRSARAYRE